MKPHVVKTMISEGEVEARIREVAEKINEDYAGKPLHLIGILKGSVPYMWSLARHLTMPLTMDFMSCSSYGGETKSSGIVRLNKDLDEPIEGRNIMIVEDIIDSGHTLSYLKKLLEDRHPASIKLTTLLDKPSRRVVDDVTVDNSLYLEEAQESKERNDRAAAADAFDKIRIINSENPDANALEAAKKAYASLTDDQKTILGSSAVSYLENAQKKRNDLDEKARKAAAREAARIDISKAAVTVNNAVWTGNAIVPAVTVSLNGNTLRKGTDFTAAFSDNKNVGTAKVTVSGIGNYKGSKTGTFDILPAKPVNVKASALSSRRARIKWKYSGMASGFELQAAGNKSFSKALRKMTLKSGTRTRVIKKLKSRKVWYFRIRAFYKAGGRTYYSSWSAVKRIKFKK